MINVQCVVWELAFKNTQYYKIITTSRLLESDGTGYAIYSWGVYYYLLVITYSTT